MLNKTKSSQIGAKITAPILSCIRASISDECAIMVVTSVERYEIEVKKGAAHYKSANGPFYLRIQVSCITIIQDQQRPTSGKPYQS